MSRRKLKIENEAQAIITARTRAGDTIDQVQAALSSAGHTGLSQSTIYRRMQEARKAPVRVEPDASDVRPLPATPAEIPGDATVGEIDTWLARIQRLSIVAEADGDLSGFGALGRLSATMMEARRKALPPDIADPNDAPDMVAMGKAVAQRLVEMVAQVVGK